MNRYEPVPPSLPLPSSSPTPLPTPVHSSLPPHSPSPVLTRENRPPDWTKKRVAVYCRVSTDKNDQANSLESQQKYFREYIAGRPDWQLYAVYADKGFSGTDTRKRKEFNRMMADAAAGALDLIITKEISRFARNTLDSIYHTRALKRYGVGVLFVNDALCTLDPDAELRLSILSSIAQEESRKTSERVKWGQQRQMEKGVVFGRSLLGYDIRKGQMYINEEGARIVRLIFDKFVCEGKGSHTIARELHEAGYKTVTGSPVWRNTTVYKILKNEKYCGDLVQKKTYTPDYLTHEKKYNKGEESFVILKNHHEPIVSREIFDQAARLLTARALSPAGLSKQANRYAFSGKIVCGQCGAKYGARFRTRKNGHIYRAWRCLTATQQGRRHWDKHENERGCNAESLRNEDILHILSFIINSLQQDKKNLVNPIRAALQSVIAGETGALTESTLAESAENVLAKQIQTITEKRTKLIDLYLNNEITHAEFATARAQYDAHLKSLNEHQTAPPPNERIKAITAAIDEITNPTTPDEVFYRNLTDRILVHGRDHIDNHIEVWLFHLPHAWRFAMQPSQHSQPV